MKFLADINVGKLARWLRVMGYDTALSDGRDDSEMVGLALVQRRVLLSRDTRLAEHNEARTGLVKLIIFHTEDSWAQLRDLVESLQLRPRRTFSRCLECNEPLVSRKKAEVQGLVPLYVFQTQRYYRQCPSCGRVYWRGTHWARMLKKLEELARVG